MLYELIIIGCSLGGLNAMRALLSALSAEHRTPVILVQHRDKTPNAMLSRILQGSTHLKVEDAEDKTEIEANKLYLAPPGYHLLIDGKSISLSTEVPQQYAMPSIDIAFETAARSYGKSLIAIVLTSSSDDGAEGARIVEERGGLVIIQDPKTAENGRLGLATLSKTKKAKVLALEDIPGYLKDILRGNQPADGGKNVLRQPS
jgi:two-component system chemotaxis response regulator CheB